MSKQEASNAKTASDVQCVEANDLFSDEHVDAAPALTKHIDAALMLEPLTADAALVNSGRHHDTSALQSLDANDVVVSKRSSSTLYENDEEGEEVEEGAQADETALPPEESADGSPTNGNADQGVIDVPAPPSADEQPQPPPAPQEPVDRQRDGIPKPSQTQPKTLPTEQPKAIPVSTADTKECKEPKQQKQPPHFSDLDHWVNKARDTEPHRKYEEVVVDHTAGKKHWDEQEEKQAESLFTSEEAARQLDNGTHPALQAEVKKEEEETPKEEKKEIDDVLATKKRPFSAKDVQDRQGAAGMVGGGGGNDSVDDATGSEESSASSSATSFVSGAPDQPLTLVRADREKSRKLKYIVYDRIKTIALVERLVIGSETQPDNFHMPTAASKFMAVQLSPALVKNKVWERLWGDQFGGSHKLKVSEFLTPSQWDMFFKRVYLEFSANTKTREVTFDPSESTQVQEEMPLFVSFGIKLYADFDIEPENWFPLFFLSNFKGRRICVEDYAQPISAIYCIVGSVAWTRHRLGITDRQKLCDLIRFLETVSFTPVSSLVREWMTLLTQIHVTLRPPKKARRDMLAAGGGGAKNQSCPTKPMSSKTQSTVPEASTLFDDCPPTIMQKTTTAKSQSAATSNRNAVAARSTSNNATRTPVVVDARRAASTPSASSVQPNSATAASTATSSARSQPQQQEQIQQEEEEETVVDAQPAPVANSVVQQEEKAAPKRTEVKETESVVRPLQAANLSIARATNAQQNAQTRLFPVHVNSMNRNMSTSTSNGNAQQQQEDAFHTMHASYPLQQLSPPTRILGVPDNQQQTQLRRAEQRAVFENRQRQQTGPQFQQRQQQQTRVQFQQQQQQQQQKQIVRTDAYRRPAQPQLRAQQKQQPTDVRAQKQRQRVYMTPQQMYPVQQGTYSTAAYPTSGLVNGNAGFYSQMPIGEEMETRNDNSGHSAIKAQPSAVLANKRSAQTTDETAIESEFSADAYDYEMSGESKLQPIDKQVRLFGQRAGKPYADKTLKQLGRAKALQTFASQINAKQYLAKNNLAKQWLITTLSAPDTFTEHMLQQYGVKSSELMPLDRMRAYKRGEQQAADGADVARPLADYLGSDQEWPQLLRVFDFNDEAGNGALDEQIATLPGFEHIEAFYEYMKQDGGLPERQMHWSNAEKIKRYLTIYAASDKRWQYLWREMGWELKPFVREHIQNFIDSHEAINERTKQLLFTMVSHK